MHFGAAFIMDEILYKQLHASINHIMENPAKLPETGKATGGGDIERGYLHQCTSLRVEETVGFVTRQRHLTFFCFFSPSIKLLLSYRVRGPL